MSAAFGHPRNTLRSHLPRAGFLWPDRASLLSRERHDIVVLNALRDHGGVASLRADAHGNTRRDVEQAFVAMIETARRDALAGRLDNFDTTLDWMADLRVRLSWGDFVEEDMFIDLFLRIVRARKDWHVNPREPFNTKEHGPLAHAIDAFYSVVSDDWLGVDEELFRGVLPPVVEPAREVRVRPRRLGADPTTAAPQAHGAGASSAATEVDEDEDEDEDDKDIEMGEGEMEDVRERLARTEIGEDEEEDEDIEMED